MMPKNGVFSARSSRSPAKDNLGQITHLPFGLGSSIHWIELRQQMSVNIKRVVNGFSLSWRLSGLCASWASILKGEIERFNSGSVNVNTAWTLAEKERVKEGRKRRSRDATPNLTSRLQKRTHRPTRCLISLSCFWLLQCLHCCYTHLSWRVSSSLNGSLGVSKIREHLTGHLDALCRTGIIRSRKKQLTPPRVASGSRLHTGKVVNAGCTTPAR